MKAASHTSRVTVTLTKFVLEQEQANHLKFKDLAQLMNAIQTAIKAVSNIVRRAGLKQYNGLEKPWHSAYYEQNLEETVKTLMINMLKSSYTTSVLVVPGEDAIIVEREKQGDYVVCLDPLDGTSNIESLVPVGTIFGIFKKQSHDNPSSDDALQKGRNLLAAGYALYGSATVLVLSLGYGVQEFLLDPNIGEFVLTSSNIRIPEKGHIYSINEGYSKFWYAPVEKYIESLKNPQENGDGPYTGRYIGTMVADVHRTLKYGGIFMYPCTKDCIKGKLRLLYECIPMAFLVEQAGGKAITTLWSLSPVLDVQPDSIHQKVPIFLGSTKNVDDALSCFDN